MPADNPEQYLREALDLVRMYAQTANVDETDTLAAEKITSLIQQLLAQGEKNQRDLLQGKMNPAAMQQALGQLAPQAASGY